jgi:hypothetical protein
MICADALRPHGSPKKLHSAPVQEMTFNSSGRSLLSVSLDRNVWISERAAKHPLRNLVLRSGRVAGTLSASIDLPLEPMRDS